MPPADPIVLYGLDTKMQLFCQIYCKILMLKINRIFIRNLSLGVIFRKGKNDNCYSIQTQFQTL